MLPLKYAPAWHTVSALLVGAALFLSLAPISQPWLPSHGDKLEHAVAYLGLALWFTGLVGRSSYWIVAVALALLSLAIEILQSAMPFGRQGDPWDMLANVCGIGIGVALAAGLTGGWAAKVEAWVRRN